MGGGVSTNHKSSNRIELSWFSQQFSNFSDLTWPPLSTPHSPTHPPNYTPTHGWGSLHSFQIFKQNWNILISSSAIEFWLIPGVPPGGVGGGWMGVGGGERVHPTHMHTHMHARTCTRIWHHREFPGIPPMGAAICMKLSCLPRVHVRACVCVHACACAHMCGAPPNHPPPPSTHPPHRQSRREPETPKFNKSWTNRDNSILFEDSLPLSIPELI